ncbi:MAG: hypothetical protein QXW77_03135 [Candidatus Hadarchaeales archaeon]
MRVVLGRSEGLRGEITPWPSKFFTQFSVALAALGEGRSEIGSPLAVEDTLCLLPSLKKLGVEVKRTPRKWTVWGTAGKPMPTAGAVDAKGSATSLSLLCSISALAGKTVVVTGNPSLRSRPLPELLRGLQRVGVSVLSSKETDSPPFVIMGARLRGGRVKLNMPDKYLPSLILPCLFGERNYHLQVKGGRRLEMALKLLAAGSVKIASDGGLRIPREVPKGFRTTVPPDPDLLAPFSTLAVLSDSKILIRGEEEGIFLSLLRRFGLKERKRGKTILIEGPQPPTPTKLDVSGFPEFFPLLCVTACFAKGTSVLFGLSPARKAKTDRVSTMVKSLRKMGARIKEDNNRVIIRGPSVLRGCTVDPGEDPCTAAALAVAGLLAEGQTIIENAQALRLTYPAFLASLRRLGVELTVG